MSNNDSLKKKTDKSVSNNTITNQKKEESGDKLNSSVEVSHPSLPESGTSNPSKEIKSNDKTPSNIVYIGKKPVMSYAMSSLIQLTHSGEIILKARGLLVSRAVDVAEIITKRLGNNAFDVKNIKIDTEKLGEGDNIRSVSTIEIVIGKK